MKRLFGISLLVLALTLVNLPRLQAQTTDMEGIKQHYYRSHESISPRRIVPLGPSIDFDAPHGRDALGAG